MWTLCVSSLFEDVFKVQLVQGFIIRAILSIATETMVYYQPKKLIEILHTYRSHYYIWQTALN